MIEYWILFIVMSSAGANGGVAVERVNYPTEQSCLEASAIADRRLEPWPGLSGSFCLKAMQ
jgi:hypothetical protein